MNIKNQKDEFRKNVLAIKTAKLSDNQSILAVICPVYAQNVVSTSIQRTNVWTTSYERLKDVVCVLTVNYLWLLEGKGV